MYTDSFLGFTYNGKHSSEFGIVRTSSGGNFSVSITAPFQNKTISVPKATGQIFYGSKHEATQVSITFAFDGITEMQLQALRGLYTDEGLHELVLDEYPFKAYMAKVESIPQLKHVPFSIDGQRLYRGEGSIVFKCYYPYAKSVHNYIEDFLIDPSYGFGGTIAEVAEIFAADEQELRNYFIDAVLEDTDFNLEYQYAQTDVLMELPQEAKEAVNAIAAQTIKEWHSASRIPSRNLFGEIGADCTLHLYNAGDMAMPMKFWFYFEEFPMIYIHYKDKSIIIDEVKRLSQKDHYLVVDTQNWLVYGADENGESNGTMYNQFLVQDDFFEVARGEQQVSFSGSIPFKIEYNYLYF